MNKLAILYQISIKKNGQKWENFCEVGYRYRNYWLWMIFYQLSISERSKYNFPCWFQTKTFMVIISWLANFAVSIGSIKASGNFTDPFFIFIFRKTLLAMNSIHLFTSIKDTWGTLKLEWRIAICTNSFLISNTSFFYFSTNSILS